LVFAGARVNPKHVSDCHEQRHFDHGAGT
jgi:hypothetical protein